MTEFEQSKEKEQLQRVCSESFFSAVKQRLSPQMIGAYILSGDAKTALSKNNFKEREEEAFSKLNKLIAEKCGEDAEKVIDQINEYSSVIEEIYFNLGLKAGAVLQCRLTDNFETDI